MKKIMSLLLVIVMSVMCFSAVTVSAEDVSSNITLPFTDDFSGERIQDGNLTEHWLRGAAGDPRIDMNNDTLSLERTTNTLWAWSDARFGLNLPSITSGVVLFSFDIDPQTIVDNTETEERTFRMYVGSEALTADNLHLPATANNIRKAAGFEIIKARGKTDKYFHGGWGTGFIEDTENSCDKKGWRHVDVVVDMDNRTLATYLDHKILNAGNKLPDGFTGVNSLLFICSLNLSTAFIDNVNIVKDPVMSVTSVDANEAAKYVDITFNYDVINEIAASDVIINSANNTESVAVTKVEKPSANVIRAYYSNLNGGNYTININNVSSLFGNISVSKSFITALAYLSEDFSNAAINGTDINEWLMISNGNAEISITGDGKLAVTGRDGSSWEKVVKINPLGNKSTENQAFINIYKAIRKGGFDGGTFTAGTTYTGKLSYEFDMEMDGGTAVMYTDGIRIFRANAGSVVAANGFHAGTNTKIDSMSANTVYKIKIVFDFENQQTEYYFNGKKKNVKFVLNDSGSLSGADIFTKLYFGISNGATVKFDNIMIKYYADSCNVQNLKFTSEGTTYKVTGELINLSDNEIGAAVIFALYNGNYLVNAKLIEKPVSGFRQTILNEKYTLPENTTYTSGKVFIWNMSNSIRPLCNSEDLIN